MMTITTTRVLLGLPRRKVRQEHSYSPGLAYIQSNATFWNTKDEGMCWLKPNRPKMPVRRWIIAYIHESPVQKKVSIVCLVSAYTIV